MIDTHAHLFLKPLDQMLDEVALRASSTLTAVINSGIDPQTSIDAVALAEQYPLFWASVGIHPNEADIVDHSSIEKIRHLSFHPKVVAIGETGLDLFRTRASLASQEALLRLHLELAKTRDLPVVFHVRDAHDDFVRIISEYKDIRGVLHAFSGDRKVVDWILNNTKLFFGIGGPITFKNFKEVDLINSIPLERMLTETDCPFLAPHPHRGKINEPSYIPLIVSRLAQIKGLDAGVVDKITSMNASTLFNIPLPVKGNSQVFLRSDTILDKIASVSDYEEKGSVLEIGAGEGVLTKRLTNIYKKVFAIEPDVQVLKQMHGITVIPKSVLDVDFSSLSIYLGEKIHVFGNIPYHITTPILFHILKHRDSMTSSVLLMQKEVAMRLVSNPGSKDYGILSVILGNFFEIKLLFDVPPGSFSPVPDVMSSVIIMIPRKKLIYEKTMDGLFESIVRASFAKRRKMLRTCFRDLGLSDSVLTDFSNKRAEQLTIEEFGIITDTVRALSS
jgi:TatD DNase family protein